jgi:hypothetical protein
MRSQVQVLAGPPAPTPPRTSPAARAGSKVAANHSACSIFLPAWPLKDPTRPPGWLPCQEKAGARHGRRHETAAPGRDQEPEKTSPGSSSRLRAVFAEGLPSLCRWSCSATRPRRCPGRPVRQPRGAALGPATRAWGSSDTDGALVDRPDASVTAM